MTDSAITEQAPHGPAVTAPSSHGHLSNSTPTDEFIAFVQSKEKEYTGRDGCGEEQHYVPFTELYTYWTVPKIREACESYSEAFPIRHRLIKDRYLRVFSTLVFIGKLPFLPAFERIGLDDQKFPGTTLPDTWEHSPSHRSMFDEFKSHQWTFFPVILDRDSLDNTWLPPERILPVRVQATIREQLYNERATITKVQFHPSCNSLVESDGTSATNPSYILKTYHGQRHEQHYQHKVQAFARLHQNPISPRHVVKCHATFKHGETYNLVMEWVPGGDLLQYFQERQPPRTFEDITDFWDSLLKLNIGLDRIHQIVLLDDRSDLYQLVHQNIKPDNILLGIHSPSRPYQFSPIVGDLGHSHIRHVKADNPDIPAVDHRGNQMYSAPESNHYSDFRRMDRDGITWHADIFSAGAVFSDAASWVAKGEVGRMEYFDRRREQLENTEGFVLSGHEAAFHDGSERLSSVDEMHRDIRTTLPSHDRTTPRVLNIIENHMLVFPKDRLRANLLYSKFEKEVQDVKEEAQGEEGGLDKAPPARSLDISPKTNTRKRTKTGCLTCRKRRIKCDEGKPICQICIKSKRQCEGYNTRVVFKSPMGAIPGGPFGPIPRYYLDPTEALVSAQLSSTHAKAISSSQGPLPLIAPKPPSPEDALQAITEAGSILSMRDAADWRKAMKLEGGDNSKGKKGIDELIENLEGRDLLFLVDDTDSMQEYSMQIEAAFQTLAYVAKSIDPNDLELSFVSKPSDIIKSRKTSFLLEEVRQHLRKRTSVKGRIDSSLSTLIKEKIMRLLPLSTPLSGQSLDWFKPMTIFVFTDGKWGEGVPVGNGLTAPISKLMREIKKHGLNRTHVMFQFLRFGNDERGREHLDYLNEFGKQEDWNIVDTRDISGDVYSMFHAVLARENPAKSDTAEKSGQVVPEYQSSKEETLVEYNHTHESGNKDMSAEAPEVEEISHPRSDASPESFRDSPASTRQLSNSALSIHSSFEAPVPLAHIVIKPDPQLATHYGTDQEKEDFKRELSEYEVSKDEILQKDRFESQKKALSDESHPVARRSDLDTNPSSEGLDAALSSTSQDSDLEMSVVTIPLSARVTRWMTDRLWPPRKGSQRIWYLCGCNRHTYIDVEVLEPGGALESVRESIVKSAAAVRGLLTSPQSGGSNSSQPNLATPSPVYSGSTYSRVSSMTPTQTTATNLPSLSNELAVPTTAPDSSEPQMMHLLVCISGREYETLPKVRHLEVSDRWNDGMLLRELQRVYEQARQGRHWSVSLLLPSLPASFRKSSYVKSLRESQVLSSIRDSPVWEWLFRWAPDGGLWAPLYLPSTADFVKFQVLSQTATREPYPDQFECGQWPSSANPWPYSYRPVPMRLTTMNIPLWHELRYPGPHLGYQWFNAAAKKLDGRLFNTPLPNDCLPDIVGYGIRINERLNEVLILWWSWVAILITGIVALVYIRLTGDHSSAFGLGAYLVAALAVYIQLQYAWWRRS